MTSLVDHVLNLDPTLVYVVVGLLVFVEDALFVGFVVPGETAAILGGVVASHGHVNVVLLAGIVVLAAIVGDSVGYEVGRHLGTRVLNTRLLAKRRKRLDDARKFMQRRGGSAVFLGRFVAFFRAVMPALAGTARMRYPVFLAYNATGGLLWGVSFVLVGYLAGNSYRRIEKVIGRGSALAALAVVIVGIVVWRIRRHRAEDSAHGDGD